ncbi:hypothetical protein [Polaribacter sp. Asnod1-A03]|uniref:hypothetical protein n=1 Tax=Polaribacter sp. Asnod1-A03 TaxID=3160581 RepID=UPI00386C933B
MSKKTELFFIAIFSIFIFSCKTNDVHNQGKKNNEKIILENNEKEVEISNEEKSKILILRYTVNKSPVITFNYQVIDAKTKEELKKGVFVGTKLEWLDNTTLKATPHIGIIQKENDEILDDSKAKNKQNQYIIIKIK